ncbi:MAG: GAF domain-containing protein, partial [Herpetosiphon sp.]|nr:GAF domain-containing protein [Herpetosiphon sp.]
MTNSLDLATHELALCQRELKAIYALDRLRDQHNTTEPFLQGCVQIIRTTLDADLIQMITLDLEDCPAQHITIERWRPQDGNKLMLMMSEALSEGKTNLIEDAAGSILVRALTVRGERLGVLILGRKGTTISADDQRLIDAMCSQIDSAMANLRTLHQLEARNRELNTIYKLDRLIDSTPDFDSALTQALMLMSETINATWSFIMLYTADERELELRAASHKDLSDENAPVASAIRELARDTINAGKLVRREQINNVIGSYLGVPLILKDQVIGVFGGANPPGMRGFSITEVKMLNAIASQMDTALFEDREQRHIKQTFARYVSPTVVDMMLRMPNQDFLNVHRQPLTVLFSD